MKRLVLAVAAAVALAAVAGVSVARVSRPAGVMEALERAQPERVFAARLSIDADYRPCTPDPAFADSLIPRETCAEPNNPRDWDALTAGGESLHPDSLRRSALVKAIWGGNESTSLDVAIERLLKARDLETDPVSALVDLSAVHLERAARMQTSDDATQALDYALEALEHEPGNLPGLFNAALAAQAISTRDQAVERWNQYLAVDSASLWAGEARRRRDALLTEDTALPDPRTSSTLAEVQAFATRHPQRARELGWEWALGEWGKAVRESNAARADSMLTLAKGLGEALESQGGDASLADAVSAIRAAHGQQAATRTLARAHQAYAAGIELFVLGQWSPAIDSFEVVLRLHPPSRTLLGWTRTEYIAALVQNERADEVPSVLEDLATSADSVRHAALFARVEWIQASRLPSDSIKQRMLLFDRAARTYARLGESEHYGAIHYREAWAAHGEGNTTAASRMNNAALRALRPHRRSRHLHNALVQSAEMARRDGMHRAALLIQSEDDKVGMRGRNPTVVIEALQARARIRALMDSTEQARQDLDAAEPLIGQVPEEKQAKDLRGAQRYSRALLVSSGDSGSIAALDSAVNYFQGENPSWHVATLLLRAELRLDAGDLRRADADLERLTSLISGVPQRDRGFHLRATVLERMRDSHNRLVLAYVRTGKPLCALRALERSRITFAFDSTAREATREWKAPPPGHVVLEYALIGDTLLTWVVRQDSITLREQRLNRDGLLRTIARVNTALESAAHADTADADLRRLYDVLIRPVRNRIPNGESTELVIVADGEIAGVPFAALRDSATSKYLVEEHPLRFAASLVDAARAASPARRSGQALLVANPAFDRSANVGMHRLPGAEQEVAALLARYLDHVQFTDSAATVAAFTAHAARARVIHYAGHAIFNNAWPERSFLLLAGDSLSGRLTADSVSTMPLQEVELVVLSACRTLRGGQGRSSGFAGLTGAFLNAGADGVVGSLWLVNDRLTQPLMVDFHGSLQNTSPARALQSAQLARIEARAPVHSWAGFRYMGR